MERLFSFQGQQDRRNEYVREDDLLSRKLTSDAPIHKLISAMSKDFPDVLEPSRAVNKYLSAREYRHDNWCNFITDNCIIKDYKVGDRNFGDFVQGLDPELEVPKEIKNKTPDILTLSEDKSFIFLGDVTVAKGRLAANARKYEKYKPLVTFLERNNFRVNHVNFVVTDDMNVVNAEACHLMEIGLIRHTRESVTLHTEYHKVCTFMMKEAKRVCTNPTAFQSMLDNVDKVNPIDSFITVPPVDVLNVDTSPYTPTISERVLMNMIKNKVDEIDPDQYFTDDISKSLDAINSIIEENRNRPHIKPVSVLKVVDNQNYIEEDSGHKLIESYIDDIADADNSELRDYLMHILPTKEQIRLMNSIGSGLISNKDVRNNEDCKYHKVYGQYQYKIPSDGKNNQHINKLNYNLKKGKDIKNEKEEPATIPLHNMVDYYNQIEGNISYYGSVSSKPPVLPDTWEAKTLFENESTIIEKEMYYYAKSTNGAQLCNAMSYFYERITHLSTSLSKRDNIFVPPNGSFIAIVPKEHAPINSKNVDLPMIFITRSPLNEGLNHVEHEFLLLSDKYIYYVSKLCRLNIDKLSNWSNAGYKLISTGAYLLSKCTNLINSREKVIGTLTYFILDVHQKTSEFLDLLKYISFMPFSDISRLPELIRDKFDLLVKTALDGWMVEKLKRFITELSKLDQLNAAKPKLKTFNMSIVSDCLGIRLELPSFCDNAVRHLDAENFIEEINLLNTVRPKHLYGSQFMDKSITQTCEWNVEYEEEVSKYGGWATNGIGDGMFPFDAKFCYSADAIHYAEVHLQGKYTINQDKVEAELSGTQYTDFMHKNCTLRGCTKNPSDRENSIDIHTTSLEACLKEYKKLNYNDADCTAVSFACRHLKSKETQEYSMSEKDQRGGGRPIATPTLGTKAALMMIEKPEMAKGLFMPNNIIVPGKNKLREQCETYKDALSSGIRGGYKMVFQLTEDQSKYSENDNPRKYEAYIKTSETSSMEIKALQLQALKGLIGRRHLVKRLPVGVANDKRLFKYIVKSSIALGVWADIGWPQGMLNFISTNVHCGADLWITYAYNQMYPNNRVHTSGLVHSDDSWVVVCCNSLYDFKKFALFRLYAKKMFCLKLNEKKLWGSRYLGELVSNYNLNGNVHLSVSKTLANSFGNLTYQNWPIDVHNQVSSLQQCYRNGASLGVIIMLSTVLKQQMFRSYNIKGRQLEILYDIPIELGGYPDNSAFELAVNGVSCHYKKILDGCRLKPVSFPVKLIKECMSWSRETEMSKERVRADDKDKVVNFVKMLDANNDGKFSDEDYENLAIPSRGDVFRGIRHIMPKSKKMSKTLKELRALPFKSNGLELIVTRPPMLSEALGHLSAQTSNMLFDLAADKYTQNVRRLAVSQSIQSSGKVIKVGNIAPMTYNELYDLVDLNASKGELRYELIASAFNDDNDLVECTHNIVHCSEHRPTNNDKRKIINKMPYVEDKFKTIGKLQDVLLCLIDSEKKTNYLLTYSKPNVSYETLAKDADNIKKRFIHYFNYHDTIYACSLIMQQYLASTKSRLWTQPHLKNDNVVVFLEDLYGKTINSKMNYIIRVNYSSHTTGNMTRDLVQSVYCTMIMNELFTNKFNIVSVDGKPLPDVLDSIDPAGLENNDFLKLAICNYKVKNDRDYIDQYLRRNKYEQVYLVAQRPGLRGYSGFFSLKCKLDRTVLIIKGYEGNVELVSNNTDVYTILKMMKKFIRINFGYLAYSIPGSWGYKDFWNSSKTNSECYLNFYNPTSTTISNKRGAKCLPIEIRPDLTYNDNAITSIAEYYTFDKPLRVVFKHIGDRKERVANVMQSFSVPLRKNIVIEPDFVQNFDNTILYRSGAMEKIMQNKPHTIGTATIDELFNTSPQVITVQPFTRTFGNLMGKVFRTTLSGEYSRDSNIEEVTEYEVGGIQVKSLIDVSEEAAPEDLEALAIEYVEGDTTKYGSIYIPHDIKSTLATAYCGSMSKNRILQFVGELASNKMIVKWADRIGKRQQEHWDYLDNLVMSGDDGACEPSNMLFCFILASNLDLDNTWENIRLRDALSCTNNDRSITSLVKQFVVVVNDIFYCDVIEEERTLLDVMGDSDHSDGSNPSDDEVFY